MKHDIIYVFLSALSLCIFSCRPLGDDLLSYGQDDSQVYALAERSYSDEFKAFWTAMNENYCIWDYEAEFGTDWDEVYETYLPRFEAIDSLPNGVSDAELAALYHEFTDTLHDGHMVLEVKNLATGRYISLSPNRDRVMRERLESYRADYLYSPDLETYKTDQVVPNYRIKAYDAVSSQDIVAEMMLMTCADALRAAKGYLEMVDEMGGPNETNDSIYASVKDMQVIMQDFMMALLPILMSHTSSGSLVGTFNKMCDIYGLIGKQIGVDLRPIEFEMADDMLGYIRYALFEGNIAYLRIGACGLTSHLESSLYSSDTASMYYSYQKSVQRVWHHWFDTIQVLHKNGTLGGVILDMRNNTGGYVNDYKFLMGALLPSGGWDSHKLRVKNGTGRLDFGPIIPFRVETYSDEHVVVNEQPIVVLANTSSVSMAENTTWGVMSQPNGYFVGERTYGGLSALSPAPAYYSETYSGAFGVQGQTPIYGYIPKFVCLYPQPDGSYKLVEGYGFEPDIECQLDTNLWINSKRDNQLEKALDLIQQY